ncbi:MAG: glycosyltransferase family 4 protein [Candidatus Latescibacteria bacterium]|nr:glycosyltransferase family 4 protein [Candidatus Latescibacterota bacterium]
MTTDDAGMHVCMVVFGDLCFDFRVYREAKALADAGHRVSLIATDFHSGPMPAEWDAFGLHLIPLDRGHSLRFSYPHFWRLAARQALATAADVFHAHDLDALWPAARAARRLAVPLVYDSHELFSRQSSLVNRPLIRGFWEFWERRLLRTVDRVLTVSDAIAEDLRRRYNLTDLPAVVRNLPPWREPVAESPLRQALGLIGDPEPLALYQGGFLTDNGLGEMIQAMVQIDWGRLVLLGGGPTESALRQQVVSHGLQDRVRFLPRVPFPELHEWTCGADVGVCVIKPTGESFAWSLPNKLFEYFIAGLPVLAGDTPQIRRVMLDTGAGVVADPENPSAIADSLRGLFADAEGRSQLSVAARSAARRFCWEKEAPRLLALYESL